MARWAVTACTQDCPDACSLKVRRTSDNGLEIRGNPDHPFTRGFICSRVRSLGRRLFRSDRITRPRLKTPTGWRSISWDEALERCAEHLQACRRRPESILLISGEGAKGVLKLSTSLFFETLGATTTFGALCDAAGIAAFMADFGALELNSVEDLLLARRIVNWGRDFSRSSIHLASWILKARKQGIPVLTISPGGDGNAPFTDIAVRIRPGTDRFLAAAVLKELKNRSGWSEAAVERTSNLPRLEGILNRWTVGDLLDVCGVSPEDLSRVVEFYAASGPTATFIGWGLQRYAYGAQNVRFINAVVLLSGNMGIAGCGSRFGIPSLRNFNTDWTRPPSPPSRRLSIAQIGRAIEQASDPPIEFAWIHGSNIVNQAPESKRTAEALKRVPFVVVVDAFETDTVRCADLVLPSTLMLEQEDIVGSYLHNYIHYARPVVPPPQEARCDHDILRDLGARLDPPVLLPEAETCLREALRSPYLDIDLEELRRRHFVKAKRPDIAFQELRFAHSDGRARVPDRLDPEADAPAEYPFRLLTLIRRRATHSQISPEDQELPPVVHLHPESLDRAGVPPGTEALMRSPIGRLVVRVEPDPTMVPNTVIYRRGDWMCLGGGANQLIEARETDLGHGAAYYQQYVRLEPIDR